MTTYHLLQIAGACVLALVAGQLFLMLLREWLRLRSQLQTERMLHEGLLLDLRVARAERKRVEESGAAWNGVRKFSVSKKEPETSDVFSFYLTPHDQKPLPLFKPGQYLTFELDVPNQKKKIIRCYSLSDRARPDQYRVTIKRSMGRPGDPAGVGSSYFHDVVEVGTLLDIKAPSGHFYLDPAKQGAVVLISGGVGITPCLSMLNELLESGSKRDIWWFYGVRNSKEHILKSYVESVASKHDNVHLHVCYSQPLESDKKGADYQHEGRVTVDLFKELLPSSNYDYFLCGPNPLMESVVRGLEAWGVPDERVHFEAFGPASVKRAAAAPAAAAAASPVVNAFTVTFAKSNKVAQWDGTAGSLLEFAGAQGVALASGCCAGQCGTCVTALRSGEVAYTQSPGSQPDKGTCLACIAIPKSDLVIDA